MQSIIATRVRSTEIAKVIETEEDLKEFQQHLKEIVDGSAFRGSQRSGQFLKYIAEQAISGHFDALKERSIGVELFGRVPTYDTGEDAIVRVTASDVRRRLLQHYGKYGFTSEFRISLPLGSYIPEITREPLTTAGVRTPLAVPEPPVAAPVPVTAPHVVGPIETPEPDTRRGKRWLLFAVLVIGCNTVLWGIVWSHFS